MKIDTSKLKGKPLDYAAAKADEVPVDNADFNLRFIDAYSYSADGERFANIITREGISIRQHSFAGKTIWDAAKSVAPLPSEDVFAEASWTATAADPITAAMRCFVEYKLGKEIDIPDELVKTQIDIIPTTWAVSNKSYIGEVIGMKDPEHLVQFIGKNTYIAHEIKNLDRTPAHGEKVTIKYDGKRHGQVIPRTKEHTAPLER